jgi:hypothetical protein
MVESIHLNDSLANEADMFLPRFLPAINISLPRQVAVANAYHIHG